MKDKEIIYNPDCLEEINIDEEKEKVRLLITNSNEEILVGNYSGTYLLPGGKVEKDEDILSALKREIKEEVGINLTDDIELLTSITYYQKDYPKMDDSYCNRKITTHYFTVNLDIDLNNIVTTLTDREKNGNFKLEWIDENSIKDLINNSKSNNPRKKYFNKELLQVLELYKKGLGSDCMIKCDDKLIDMHTHTLFSDGELSPKELLEEAYKNNIKVLSITDHDTILGLKNIMDEHHKNWDNLIELIPGIELSAKSTTGRMHILGYGIDIDNPYLNSKLIEIRNNSIYHIISLLHQLKKDYNIVFSTEDIQDLINDNHNLNRVDLAKLCIKYNLANSVKEAFNKYLIEVEEKIRKEKRDLSYIECFDLIIKSGGIPVLAHPKSLELNEIELLKLIKEMINNGLMGIECYHSSFSKEETEFYLGIANSFGLLISGGSDFHGKSIKPNIELGTGKNNNLNIKKLTLLDKLKR